MSRLALLVPGLLAFSLCSCGPVEIKIGPAEGAKPLNGSVAAHIDTSTTSTFKCGDVITAKDTLQTYTVTSRAVSGGCEFTFDQDVEILAKSDYDSIKDFKQAVHFVNRVEVAMHRLDFYDDNGVKFELDTRIRDLELWVNGEQVLNMEQVRSMPSPHNVVLAGPALELIKKAVKNREACSLHVMAKVVLLDSAVPTGVRCEYESQPTYIVSTSEI
jgi:hypothetical protein